MTQITRVQFQALRDRATQVGWTYEDYRRYIRLWLILQDLRKTETRNFWSRVLMDLSASHKDPKRFWDKVKRLSGRSTGPDSYLSTMTDNNSTPIRTRKDYLLLNGHRFFKTTMTTMTLPITTLCLNSSERTSIESLPMLGQILHGCRVPHCSTVSYPRRS